MLQIKKVKTAQDLQKVEDLAKVIWPEHYAPIIGATQVDYMLSRFQSITAMEQQVGEGAEYWLLIDDGIPSGYFCIIPKGLSLFLSKLYVLKEKRGKGMGKKALFHIGERAKHLGCETITLTVNRRNYKAIQAYEKWGFRKKGTQLLDIGGNYQMDDYLLEKKVTIKSG